MRLTPLSQQKIDCPDGKQNQWCFRKYMRHNKKIPRNFMIEGTATRAMVVSGLRKKGSKIEMLDKEGNVLLFKDVVLSYGYPRNNPKKPLKVTNKISLDSDNILLDFFPAISKYNILLAVDTNTDKNISMCGIVIGKVVKTETKLDIQYGVIKCFEFRNLNVEIAEKIALKKVIESILISPPIMSRTPVGIIVDHVPDPSRINKREVPLIDDFYIPENIELIYAGTDNKNDTFLNQMLASADKFAKERLCEINEGKIPEDHLHVVEKEPYTHFRFWFDPNFGIDLA